MRFCALPALAMFMKYKCVNIACGALSVLNYEASDISTRLSRRGRLLKINEPVFIVRGAD